jgi:hypothetical protein
MADPLDDILRKVAAGELSPDDAEPIVSALSSTSAREAPAVDGSSGGTAGAPGTSGTKGRAVRVRVQERGRTVVNLCIPMSWTGLTSLVPGLSTAQVQRITEALRNGERGPVVDVQDANGDGVVISTE